MAQYKLTREADSDLDGILDFGIDRYGIDKAIKYYDKFTQRFSEIVEQPFLYQTVDNIRAGYRRSVCGVHSIYYRVDQEEIVIVRILHHQDPKKAL